MLAFFISGCTQVGKYDFATYEGPSFTIDYPTNWTYNQTPGALIFIGEGANFPPVLTVMNTTTSTTPQQAAAQAKITQSVLNNYAISSEGNATISGRSGYERTYSWSDVANDLNVTQTQAWVSDRGTLYTITATTLKNESGTFEPVFIRMIDSFTIKNATGNVTPGPVYNQTNSTSNTSYGVYYANLAPPANVTSSAYGNATLVLLNNKIYLTGYFNGLSSNLHSLNGSPAHIHMGMGGPILYNLNVNAVNNRDGFFNLNATIPESQVNDLVNGSWVVNVHTDNYPDGEISGKLLP